MIFTRSCEKSLYLFMVIILYTFYKIFVSWWTSLAVTMKFLMKIISKVMLVLPIYRLDKFIKYMIYKIYDI